ncbi:MAG: ankyrin repeat domain-containing protein [Oligoflexia bacterium]|nr:ankyrin repeat domain-containing protein [Oligoflexia bacterium]
MIRILSLTLISLAITSSSTYICSTSSQATITDLKSNNLQDAIYQALHSNDQNQTLSALKSISEYIKYANLKTDLLISEINASNEFNDTILILGSSYNFIKLVEELLQIPGININHQNKMGNTALHWAIENGNLEIVKLLCSHPQIDLSIKNNNNETAITLAQKPNRSNLLSIISNHSSSINKIRQSKKGQLLKVLKKNKSDSNLELDPIVSLEADKIILSIEESDPIYLPLLKKIKEDFINNRKLKWYWELALNSGSSDIDQWPDDLQYLAEIDLLMAIDTPLTDIDLNKTSQFSQSSILIRSSFHGFTNTVKRLIEESNLNINYRRPRDGRRALDAALIKGNLQIAKLLLSRKNIEVNYKISSENDFTPRDYAKKNKFFEIVTLIENHLQFQTNQTSRSKTQ